MCSSNPFGRHFVVSNYHFNPWFFYIRFLFSRWLSVCCIMHYDAISILWIYVYFFVAVVIYPICWNRLFVSNSLKSIILLEHNLLKINTFIKLNLIIVRVKINPPNAEFFWGKIRNSTFSPIIPTAAQDRLNVLVIFLIINHLSL